MIMSKGPSTKELIRDFRFSQQSEMFKFKNIFKIFSLHFSCGTHVLGEGVFAAHGARRGLVNLLEHIDSVEN